MVGFVPGRQENSKDISERMAFLLIVTHWTGTR
jgi:hypothetical protein